MLSVPFKAPDSFEGFAQTAGLARLEGDVLTLEFETKDAVFGALKTNVKEIRIPLERLAAVDFTANIFKTHLTLRAHRMETLADLPGSQQGQGLLRFARKDRELARELANALDLRLAELRLARLERDGD